MVVIAREPLRVLKVEIASMQSSSFLNAMKPGQLTQAFSASVAVRGGVVNIAVLMINEKGSLEKIVGHVRIRKNILISLLSCFFLIIISLWFY